MNEVWSMSTTMLILSAGILRGLLLVENGSVHLLCMRNCVRWYNDFTCCCNPRMCYVSRHRLHCFLHNDHENVVEFSVREVLCQ